MFSGPDDRVDVQRWDEPMHTLSTTRYAAAFLRSQLMAEDDAARAAAGLPLPLTLTMRGCFVYATKG
ncbi:MAG TPA: hypothetical protein VHY31_28605 [Streptosporangiaceae bacterium]|nr:hypothetical protein [Streptosporangiaceae bacterium]